MALGPRNLFATANTCCRSIDKSSRNRGFVISDRDIYSLYSYVVSTTIFRPEFVGTDFGDICVSVGSTCAVIRIQIERAEWVSGGYGIYDETT